MIPRRPERTILTYGTFDLFHQDHVTLLKRLFDMGGNVIVGCSTDAFSALKGETCVMSYAQRHAILKACRYVSLVIPETCWDQKRTDIVNYNVSVFAMGEAWRGAFDDLNDLAEVIYLPHTEIASAASPAQTLPRGRPARVG